MNSVTEFASYIIRNIKKEDSLYITLKYATAGGSIKACSLLYLLIIFYTHISRTI